MPPSRDLREAHYRLQESNLEIKRIISGASTSSSTTSPWKRHKELQSKAEGLLTPSSSTKKVGWGESRRPVLSYTGSDIFSSVVSMRPVQVLDVSASDLTYGSPRRPLPPPSVDAVTSDKKSPKSVPSLIDLDTQLGPSPPSQRDTLSTPDSPLTSPLRKRSIFGTESDEPTNRRTTLPRNSSVSYSLSPIWGRRSMSGHSSVSTPPEVNDTTGEDSFLSDGLPSTPQHQHVSNTTSDSRVFVMNVTVEDDPAPVYSDLVTISDHLSYKIKVYNWGDTGDISAASVYFCPVVGLPERVEVTVHAAGCVVSRGSLTSSDFTDTEQSEDHRGKDGIGWSTLVSHACLPPQKEYSLMFSVTPM